MPKLSYLFPDEWSKSARGMEAMRAKVCIKISVSANSTGTHVISPIFIGSSKMPVCFDLLEKSDDVKSAAQVNQMRRWQEKDSSII